LFSIGREVEEAAMDLGASPLQALRMVLLPLLWPAVLASLMIAFAISIDDFVISAFLVGGQDSVTIPVKLYSSARLAPSPALNALASILLISTLVAVALAGLAMKRFRRREGVIGSAVEDIARLEI
jgi:spermidine/putrescine transport system permease protein